MQRLIYSLAIALFLCASQARAEQYITLGAGAFDFDSGGFNPQDKGSAEFMGEWRGNAFFTNAGFFNNFIPVVGAWVNTDGGAMGYAGVAYDWEFLPNWYITPGADIGAWREGSSLDLGGTFEFHESLELDYKFYGDYRAGIAFTHTSNAHIYNENPGANSLLATVSIPFGN